jgi:hypothetical protein
MSNNITITIDGINHVFTEVDKDSGICDNCSLLDLCHKTNEYTEATICEALDLTDYDRYSFKASCKDKDIQTIDDETYARLKRLGLLDTDVRSHNVGNSDYSKHVIQPWSIWLDYDLNPWDADIIKRVLRHKATDTRKMDYEKIIHICEERIRQIDENP